jgi:predicted glycogen debranching enzyme
MKITKDNLNEFTKASSKEWLITNGIGGFASSTVVGVNTRRYHGLLIAELGKHYGRHLVLSKLDESIEINNEKYNLYTNQCVDYISDGYKYQEEFNKLYFPEMNYKVKDVRISKKICMVNGENTVSVVYNIQTFNDAVSFNITPLVNFRNFHNIRRSPYFKQEEKDDYIKIVLCDDFNLYIRVSEGEYLKSESMFYNMYYNIENERGLDNTEDHFIPGTYQIHIKPQSKKIITFVATICESNKDINKGLNYDGQTIIKIEKERLDNLFKLSGAKTETKKLLNIAADNFIINKDGEKTIIAGYPWFGDWGRDAFISLEGLTINTKRFEDAKSILIYFSKYIKDGLIPNYIDENKIGTYNSVDASLWFIEAIYKYFEATKDIIFLKNIYSKMLEIFNAYRDGTINNIYMDKDGLINSGDSFTQLTWMDAKVDNIIPTPRYGKAVEINALWYNTLKILELFSKILNKNFDLNLSKLVKKSFKKFYSMQGLYDTIEPLNTQIRPNQIIAAGLSFPVITNEKAKEVFQIVKEKLYTKKGLRTLSIDDSNYKGIYKGNTYYRDLSYHQGTVWPWLLGPYCNAYKKIFNKKLKINILEMLSDDCIGNVCEIYDGNEPQMPRGAFAQAWSASVLIDKE